MSTITDVMNPPRTIMEVYDMLPEGTLAEIINGKLEMSPSPNIPHQRILLELATNLKTYTEKEDLGEIFIAPCDVILEWGKNVFQPDIIFISKENQGILKKRIEGAPDLLIEIESPGSEKRDWKTKKSAYESYGVKEYWIVDPGSKQVSVFTLESGVFHQKSPENPWYSQLFARTFELK